MARFGLAIDIGRCTGCYACIVACKSENYTRPGVSWIRIEEREDGEFPNVSRTYVPMLCVQCGEMPCAQTCPSGAIAKGDGGIVLVDPESCIRCLDAPCVQACPFDVMSVNGQRKSYFSNYVTPMERDGYEAHRDGVAEKCTLCHHRVSTGMAPACVQACPSRALIFGDLEERASDLAQLAARVEAKPLGGRSDIDPSVFYTGLESGT